MIKSLIKVKSTQLKIQSISIKTASKKKVFYSHIQNLGRGTEVNDDKKFKRRKINLLMNKFLLLNSFSKYFDLRCLTKKILSDFFNKKIDIRLTSNNVFCTYTNLITNKIIHGGSSGKYKIKMSRKRLKTASRNILDIFFYKLKKDKIFDKPIINLTAPKHLRLVLIRRLLKKEAKKKELLLKIKPTKCFNGCRASKRRRKKSLRFRVYK
jgi:ribosomal protein S11